MSKGKRISEHKKEKYDHSNVEKKWQEVWSKQEIYSPDIGKTKNKFYNLWMYPYPSGEGLHAGHAFASTGSDIYGRYIRMNGNNVFQPIGYDSFGMHSENFALTIGEHPKKMLDRTTKNYERQLKELGHGYDWTKTVTVSDIDYYRWTQWLFVQLFKAGLAYRKKAEVNWCPSCKTVLADEQVMTPAQAGKEPKGLKKGQNEDDLRVCERCGYVVERKSLTQWFFRITEYADKLLSNMKKIEWPEKIKIVQRNWIGKSRGATLKFQISKRLDPGKNLDLKRSDLKNTIELFTTRPDTLYGATFFVLSPEHTQVNDVTVSKYKSKVQKYIEKSKQKTKEDRIADKEEKTGVFTGGYVVNPATKSKIPVYIADYVLMGYGTGAIMGVPAHDQRDWDFARKNNIEIIEVVSGGNVDKEAYTGLGKLVNSGKWNGLEVPKEISKTVKDVEKEGWGKKAITYHLRDWLISRQRYWGPPIPMIFCKHCAKLGKSYYSDIKKSSLLHKDQSDWESKGWWPEENLPVELPFLKDYKPKGTGRGPLADHKDFYEVNCPKCGKLAERETDVSDTFLDSSWYFLRYPSVGADSASKLPFDPKITKKWLPVDLYFGGAEHSVLHLMYSRFVTQVLYDLDYLDFEEPFTKFYAHGLMIKDGAKMSKSRGNTVNPDEYIGKYGADTLRLYLMFMGPMDGYPDFRDEGIEGMRRFTEKIWQLFSINNLQLSIGDEGEQKLRAKLHQTIKKVTEDIQKFHYNTAISAIMELVNTMRGCSQPAGDRLQTTGDSKAVDCELWTESLKALALMLAPFAPHLAEEVWQKMQSSASSSGRAGSAGKFESIHTSKWPQYDSKYIKTGTVTIAVQVNGKLRSTISVQSSKCKVQSEVIKLAKEDEKIQKWLDGKKTIKEIFIPRKLVNFVVNP